jgi:hypothetical protein
MINNINLIRKKYISIKYISIIVSIPLLVISSTISMEAQDRKVLTGQVSLSYALLSESSGQYLDDGDDIKIDPSLIDINQENPSKYQNLQWSIEPADNNLYAIHSQSSRKYLDGGQPDSTIPLMAAIDEGQSLPENLKWSLQPDMNNSSWFTIYSPSSQKYLDGRNPKMSQPLISQPPIDNYLKWCLMPDTRNLTNVIRGNTIVGKVCQSLVGAENTAEPAPSLIPGIPSLKFVINGGQAGALNIDQQSAICFTIPTAPGVTVQYIIGCARWVPVNELFQVPAETRLTANNVNTGSLVNAFDNTLLNLSFKGLNFGNTVSIGKFNLTVNAPTTDKTIFSISPAIPIPLIAITVRYFSFMSNSNASIMNCNGYNGIPSYGNYIFTVDNLGFNADDILDGDIVINLSFSNKFDLSSLSNTIPTTIHENILSKFRQINFKK